jgi:hypothetical protein
MNPKQQNLDLSLMWADRALVLKTTIQIKAQI